MSKNNPSIHVLIAAAGSGTRMSNKTTPKQYLPLQSKTILRHSIDTLMALDGVKSLCVIINPDHEDLFNKAIKGLDNVTFTYGSNSRKQSINNGLKLLLNVENEDLILIHDAARPFADVETIKHAIQTAQKSGASTLAAKITDTLYDDEQNQTIPRDDLWAIQTPQIFKYELIHTAHEQFKDDESFTDDRGMVEAIGHNVSLVETSAENFKITTNNDYERARILMSNNTKTRTALGFDVHAFEDGSSVRLGGIDIPHNKSLKGHSDADVVLHAITDAILGTINEGDIGTHFPPSDPQWKDADSALFLSEAINKLNAKQSTLDFIDVTIMAEEPKIGPHRTAMQSRIADITGLSAYDISIKATTTEGLGFTGRREGIACQCAVTITTPKTN